MTYKGYAARIEFDAEDRIFFGRLTGIRDIVTFHGETVNELEAALKEAVDDYLSTCAKLGDDPNWRSDEMELNVDKCHSCN